MKTRVGVVHTFLYSVEDIKAQFRKYLPEVEMINIIDDSLLEEALANKGVTPALVSRLCDYYSNMQNLGCACVLNQCSSVGEASDIAGKLIDIPIVKIDGPMAQKAVELGNRIAVIATAISTVGPSCRLVEGKAAALGKKVIVDRCFVEGAYEFLLKTGDKRKHNEMVIERIRKEANTHDVVVLAQGSMYHLMPLLSDVRVPVLTSLESGVAQIRDVLKLNGQN
ncbi:MAG TPA: aspartate/glutamate racemase family protein [Rectinemataceae bacterium]|nr:aspartate/glutamate racemase family protein [Rectinemataceae bacterium]